MYTEFYFETIFWLAIYAIDEQITKLFHTQFCNRCPNKGKLYRSDYPRKPRGVPSSVEHLFQFRFSFCCAICRRRNTPPSIRFLGRRVYVAIFIILILFPGAANLHEKLAQLPPQSFAKITFHRWITWWSCIIPFSAVWKKLVGILPPNIENQFLPLFIMEQFIKKYSDIEKAIQAMLEFISPISVPRDYPPSGPFILWNHKFTQNLFLQKIPHLSYFKSSD